MMCLRQPLALALKMATSTFLMWELRRKCLGRRRSYGQPFVGLGCFHWQKEKKKIYMVFGGTEPPGEGSRMEGCL